MNTNILEDDLQFKYRMDELKSRTLTEIGEINGIQIVDKLKILGVHVGSDNYLKESMKIKIEDSIKFWNKFRLIKNYIKLN